MSTKPETIGIIGPFGAICGVAEYQRFFVEALNRQNFMPVMIANRFNGGYKSHGLYDGTPCFRLFGTGHAPESERSFDSKAAVTALLDAGVRVCYLNYQDYLYPDKRGLFDALARLAAKGVALYLIIHDTCLPPNFPFGLFKTIVVHSELMKSARFPTAAKVAVIPQGVPVFPVADRAKLRQDLVLCEANDLMITTFGLGRSNNVEVLKASKLATETLKRDSERNPIYVQMIFAKEEDMQTTNEQIGDDYAVYLNGGYMEDFKLAAYIQASDAVVLNYPQIPQYSTSSALRFALGNNALVFARQTNWFADVKDEGLYIPFDSVNSLGNQLASVFASDNSRKAAELKVARTTANYVKNHSWDETAKAHIALWKRR